MQLLMNNIEFTTNTILLSTLIEDGIKELPNEYHDITKYLKKTYRHIIKAITFQLCNWIARSTTSILSSLQFVSNKLTTLWKFIDKSIYLDKKFI
jgi:hypothetical protein